MDETISIICPSRLRPQNIKRFYESINNTASHPDKLEFLFYLDDDDRLSIKEVVENRIIPISERVRVFIGKRNPLLCEYSNKLSRIAKGEILFLGGDDVVFETNGWDDIVRKEFYKVKDKILLVYGDDGVMHEKLATHFFIPKKWVEILGHIVPPIFTGDWADNYCTDLISALNRKVYRSDLKLTHMHPTVGKAPMDSVYAEKYQRDIINKTPSVYNSNKGLLDLDIKKLRDFIDSCNE